ncbi:MAG: OmpA family protein [Stenotrophobium sp.]
MKKTAVSRKYLIAACALATLPLAAMAGDGPYLGAEGGVNFLKSQLGTSFNTGWVGGLTGGYAFENGLRPELELDFRRNEADAASGTDGHVKAETAMANLWYDVKASNGLFSVVHPYIGAGVGFARPTIVTTGLSAHDNSFAYQAGAGFGYDLTRNLTASVDYRFLRTDHNYLAGGELRYQVQSVMAGLRYSFGAAPAAAVAVAAPVAAAASTPEPRVIDSDGDGVPDNLDKCPNTPHGFHVDANGCIVQQTVILRGVNFEFNSDSLTAPSRETLDEVAAALNGQPELNVEINGYTDSVGAASYNQKLSKKRAEAVRSYLIGKGIKGDKLVAKGFGKEHPVASNKTAEGRTENRRVEFVVLNKPAHVKVISKDATKQSKAAAGKSAPAKHKK